MPELPEVEVTRLSIIKQIVNAKIMAVQLGKPLRWPLGLNSAELVGRTVHNVQRRGKYLIFVLDQGLLLFHLGMSGSLVFSYKLPLVGKHDHFDMVTTQGTLRLHDPRRFGAVVYAQSELDPIYIKLLGNLGVEPLTENFEVNHFYQQLKKRSASIKQVLLAGNIVVGVGNIYASEALFRAKIRPTKAASSIGFKRVERLHHAIQEVLIQAVEQGGSTLRNFSSADGAQGHFQKEAMVYGRENLPCKICAAPIRKIQQGQRSTYFCIKCQH